MIREYTSLEQLDSEVLFVLGYRVGQDNPIVRWELVRRIYGEEVVTEETSNDGNAYDRAVRNSIQRLRKQGKHICSKSNGKGYYMAKTREEYEDFKASYLGTNYEKFEIIRAMDENASSVWGKVEKPTPDGQMNLFQAVQ